jgi:DNA repair protein RadC
MNQLNTLREKAANYGLLALTDAELIKVAKLPDNYTESMQYKATRELLRREELNKTDRPQVKSSQDAADQLKHLEHLEHEEFHALYLNNANKVVCSRFISKGSESGTVVNVKEIILQASKLKATGVIIAHNHPSGRLVPSDADKDMTDKIKKALTLIDSRLLDHVIISHTGHYSFANEGLI